MNPLDGYIRLKGDYGYVKEDYSVPRGLLQEFCKVELLSWFSRKEAWLMLKLIKVI